MIGSFLQPTGPMLAVYSIQRIVSILAADGMSEDETEAYINENVLSAYCGPGTPLYIDDRWGRWGVVEPPLEPPMLEGAG
jgi:hypothetical protein